MAARIRVAIKALPWRERKVVGLYYYGDVTMKEIGNEIGVNESRVSQLHARAVQRLRKTLGRDLNPNQVAAAMKEQKQAPRRKRPVLQMAKARLGTTDRHTRVPSSRKPKPARASVPAAVAARRRA